MKDRARLIKNRAKLIKNRAKLITNRARSMKNRARLVQNAAWLMKNRAWLKANKWRTELEQWRTYIAWSMGNIAHTCISAYLLSYNYHSFTTICNPRPRSEEVGRIDPYNMYGLYIYIHVQCALEIKFSIPIQLIISHFRDMLYHHFYNACTVHIVSYYIMSMIRCKSSSNSNNF